VTPHTCRFRALASITDDAGSSLVEALTAAAVVITVSTGVALLLVRSTGAVRDAGAQSAAVLVAQQKLEQLSALEWRVDASGISRSDRASDLSVDPPDASGSGLQPSPPDALDRNVPGFADFVGPDGQWRGRGSTPVSGTAFVRRWSVVPYARDPADTIVLTVVVLPVVEASGAATHPAAVRLQTIRTRTAR
jgi:hypothetical protein